VTDYTTTYVFPWHTQFCARAESFDVRRGRAAALARLTRSQRPAILHGASGLQRGYVDLLAAAVLARRRRPVLLAEATWELGSRALDRLLRVPPPIGVDAAPRHGRWVGLGAVRMIDGPNVHYAVLSRHELETFPRVWGVDPGRVHFTPFCATARELPELPSGEGVLASGNSLRDYRALVKAAPQIEARLTLATRLRLPETGAGNIEHRFMSPKEHEARVRGSAVVVVPLLAGTDRSAGQQTYLNAMGLGKPVVVTDAPGVRDYVTDGETGLVVPNEPRALADAVNRLLTDRSLAQRLGAAARADVLARFDLGTYVDGLLELADRILQPS
jgi:glycosyltransferase involved in cell wall biosynthesis